MLLWVSPGFSFKAQRFKRVQRNAEEKRTNQHKKKSIEKAFRLSRLRESSAVSRKCLKAFETDARASPESVGSCNDEPLWFSSRWSPAAHNKNQVM